MACAATVGSMAGSRRRLKRSLSSSPTARRWSCPRAPRAPTPPRRSGRAWPRRRWRSASTASCATSRRPLPDGAEIGDPHRPRPRGARPDPPRRRPRDGRGGAGALPRHQGDDRPGDRERLLLRLRLPGRGQGDRRRPGEDRGGDARPHRGRRGLRAPRRAGRRGDRDLRGPGRGLQGRADPRPDRERRGGDRLALPQRPLRGPLSRPARPLDRPDQGDQAELARRRLLARRREAPDADPDLRHRLLLQEGARTSTWSGSRRRRSATTAASAPSSASSCCARRRRGCPSGCPTGRPCCT